MAAVSCLGMMLLALVGAAYAAPSRDETAMMQTRLNVPKNRELRADADALVFGDVILARVNAALASHGGNWSDELCDGVAVAECGYIGLGVNESAIARMMRLNPDQPISQSDLLMAIASGAEIGPEDICDSMLTIEDIIEFPELAANPCKEGCVCVTTEFNKRTLEPGDEDPDASTAVEMGELRALMKDGDFSYLAKYRTGGGMPTPWHLQRINSAEASPNGKYEQDATGKGIHIFVIDSGVANDHKEFAGRAIPAGDWNAGKKKMDTCDPSDMKCAYDRFGHGSHCAGLAGGKTHGSAPEAAIHAVKSLTDTGGGSLASTAGGFEYVGMNAEKLGYWPAIISASLGAPGDLAAMKLKVTKAVDAGVLVVVAAGNQNELACSYTPAILGNVVTVGATDIDDVRAKFSNYGTCLDIWAPGKMIESSGCGSTTEFYWESGTSMATPQVAGVSALMWERNKAEYEELLKKDAMKLVETMWEVIDCESTKIQENGKDKIKNGQEGSTNIFLFAGSTSCAAGKKKGGTTVQHTEGASAKYAGEATPPPKGGGHGGKKDKKEAAEAGGGMCFPGEGSAEVLHRGPTPVASLRAGDLVLAQSGDGQLTFEPVLDFLHAIRGQRTSFVTIVHSRGESRASHNHLIFTEGSEKLAADLQVGDQLLAGGSEVSVVLALRQDNGGHGMYAPLTASGTIVVDGVVASNYAAHSLAMWLPHSAAHTLFFPLRALHRLGLGAAVSEQKEQNDFVTLLRDQVRLESIHKVLTK